LSDTWYYSPYPDPYQNIDCLYICEFCLSFYVHKDELEVHLKNVCQLVHPPGDLIYKDDELKIGVWEIDAIKNPTYCENLAYMSKLFLDHKLLDYCLDLFKFYILTEYDEYGHHMVGYFSKNRDFSDFHNLSCILCLPFH
jgi:MOZ/SAS family/MYST family zinc finger domain